MKNPARPVLKPALLCALLVVLSSPAICSQTASLVKDIDVRDEPRSGSVQMIGVAAESALFLRTDLGDAVAVSDGSESGTRLLTEICPGACTDSVRGIGTARNVLFWTANQGLTTQLWRSDGTRPGTFQLTGLASGPSRISYAKPVIAGNLLYFMGCTDDLGCELWRTDGTRESTQLAADLVTGPGEDSSIQLGAAGERAFILGRTGVWVADAAGVRRVLTPSQSSYIDFVPWAARGDRFFFSDRYQGDLWVSDGTRAGTHIVKRFPFLRQWLTATGNGIYFVASAGQGEEMWVSDGTAQGTRKLTNFANPEPFFSDLEESRGWAVELGGRLLFGADDGTTGFRLWMSSGSPQTTVPIGEPGLTSELVQTGERVVFQQGCQLWSATASGETTRLIERLACWRTQLTGGDRAYLLDSSTTHHNLWRTDGTPEGTDQLGTIDRPDGNFFYPGPTAITASGRTVFLPSQDGIWAWSEDGGLRQLGGAGPLTASSWPGPLASFDGRVFFYACDGTARELWATEATEAATVQVTNDRRGCNVDGMGTIASESFVFFTNPQLHSMDAAGNVRLLLPNLINSRGALAFRGNIYFLGHTLTGGFDLWGSDGTPEGTRMLWDLPSGYFTWFGDSVLTDGEALYLVVDNSSLGQEIWRSDGTPEGTGRLVNFDGHHTNRVDIARIGSLTYLTTSERLWKTDGTPGGTQEVLRNDGTPLFDEPRALAAHQGSLYVFDASSDPDGVSRWKLWRTDGTPQGTVLLRRFAIPESIHDPPERSVALQGKLYFVMDDDVHGTELWVTDGTSEGTVMFADIVPGPEGSRPDQLVVAGGMLYFTAHDAAHGRELWRSDGTAAGTRLVQDIAPESRSSTPQQLKVFGDRLYFTADDDASGRELWSLPLSGPSACQPSATTLCLRDGRFRVEAQWRDFQGHLGAGRATPLTGDTGTFWFFDPSNVEVVIKVLDGRRLNNHHWVFYGALSSVSYSLTITDTETGLTRRYINPSGRLASVGDTQGFGPLGSFSAAPKPFVTPPSPPALVSGRTEPAAATGTCTPGPRRLCLNGGRFAVEAAWKDFQGNTGAGTAVPLTGDTGWFWFFDASNVEVMLKVLDGTALNGKFWVFYGALSNVEYALTVTDTQTGAVKEYRNPSGRFGSVADTGAF